MVDSLLGIEASCEVTVQPVIKALQAWVGRHRLHLLSSLALAAVLAAIYWPATSLQGVFFVGDIYRLGYPARAVYGQALREGRIPLWTPDALGGYPVLAEGQTGAYYPLNLLLYRCLPVPVALNYSVLLSFWLTGAGVLAYVRRLGLRWGAAFAAACVFMLGGFIPGHLNHLNMLGAAAWLPWLLWATERTREDRRWQKWVLVAVLFGVQGLAGHPQVSLLSALLVAGYALVGPLACDASGSWPARLRRFASCGAALALGACLAMVQWAPTYELTRLSQRGHGLESEFFTSFSLHPARWITLLSPFVAGNPYPLTSLETIGYVGALPLLAAALAPWRRRDRLVAFWVGVAGLALFLALGRWNPAYRLLMHVPPLNMFRAPARYLLWFDLAVAVLAAVTIDSLESTVGAQRAARRWWGLIMGVLLVGASGTAALMLSLDGLVAAWKWLPVAWVVLSVALLVAWQRRPAGVGWLAMAIGLLLADLVAFNAVYNRTYNATMPRADLKRAPEVLGFLNADAGADLYRIYTDERIVPVLSVMRESLYPNIQTLHGVQSVNGYYPLLPEPQLWFFSHLTPRLLDLLNVRYVLIPQLLPVDEATEAHDVEDVFARSIVGRSAEVPGQDVVAVEVEGYISHSTGLVDGTPVGEVILRDADGHEVKWTLRAGHDLAEWAYARDDVREVVRHQLPTVVRQWPARSGFPPRDHVGQTFIARYRLPESLYVWAIEVRPQIPRAYLQIERVRLIDRAGEGRLLSSLTGDGDHILVYRSPDVAIYRNERAGPRAFLTYRSRVAESEEQARAWLLAPDFDPWSEVILIGGRELSAERSPGDGVRIEVYEPEYVRLRCMTGGDAYLVLADSYYPGWIATVDGKTVPVERADVALRAVAVPSGEHVVELSYEPASWRLGGWVSVVAWIAASVALVWGSRAVMWRHVRT